MFDFSAIPNRDILRQEKHNSVQKMGNQPVYPSGLNPGLTALLTEAQASPRSHPGIKEQSKPEDTQRR